MSAVAFDTLKLARRLQEAGFSQEQAARTSEALADTMLGSDLGTKQDLTETKTELRSEIAKLREELKVEIAELRNDLNTFKAEVRAEFAAIRAEISAMKAEFKSDLREQDLRSTIKTGAMLVALFSLQIAAVRFLLM